MQALNWWLEVWFVVLGGKKKSSLNVLFNCYDIVCLKTINNDQSTIGHLLDKTLIVVLSITYVCQGNSMYDDFIAPGVDEQ